MKNKHFFLSLVFCLAFCNLSYAQNWTQPKFLKAEKVSNPILVTAECPYPDCDIQIEEVKEYYLPFANDLCQDLMVEVICCGDDVETYIWLIVSPNSPKCLKAENGKKRSKL